MRSVKRAKLLNNTGLQFLKRSFNNKFFKNSSDCFLSSAKNKCQYDQTIFSNNPRNTFNLNNYKNNYNFHISSGIFKKTFSTSQLNVNPNTSNKKSLSNENICFLKKLNNFRNNGVEYKVYNTECVFQTIWSNFAYVAYANEAKSFNNNLHKSNIDFTRTDDDSYTIFQDESAFLDFEDLNKTDDYTYKTENETSSTLQKFYFSNLKETKQFSEKYSLITRIPQEFNINLNTNRSVKIVNMGDSKLLADKEIKINFTHFANRGNVEFAKTTEADVNLELRRARSNNISLSAEKGFKVKLIARSYLEAESLNITFPDESVFRVKKIGVAENGKIKLAKSEVDIRSVFSPNKHSITDKAREASSSQHNASQPLTLKCLEFTCESSNLNIGSLQGNNYFNLSNCNVIIDNVDCNNFILHSSDTESVELFINSLGKLEENDFFYLNFSEDPKKNENTFANENNDSSQIRLDSLEAIKNKKIFLNQENKNEMLVVKINSEILRVLKNLNNEENKFTIDSELQNRLFSILHGESNFLSLLVENNRNLFDTEQVNRNFFQYLRDNSKSKDSILAELKQNNLFWNLNLIQSDYAENLMLINFYFLKVLLKDIPNSYRIIFVDAENSESIEIKEMTAWDITKKRIQNKINIAHKRVNNS